MGGFPQQSSWHDSQITLSSSASKHFFYVAFGARLGEDRRYLPCNACAASFDSACDYEIGSFTYVYFAKRDQLKTVYSGCTTDRNRLAPHNSSDVPHTSKSNGTQ